MKPEDVETDIKTLIQKASKANDSADALRFSQAANNIANAMCALGAAKSKSPG